MEIIAEIGVNHNGNFKWIPELIRQAAFGGADVAKFQLYNSMRVFGDDSRKKNEFTLDQVREIKSVCQFYGIEFMASVFDEEKIEWCQMVGATRYKIASRTLLKEPELCKKIVGLGVPVIASLGMTDQLLPYNRNIADFPGNNVQYLRCISKYPTKPADLQKLTFDHSASGSRIVGMSDHSFGISYAMYAIAQGATIIEKHFTMDKSLDGNDHIGSMNLEELQTLNTLGRELAKTVENLT